jgi:nucleotide-binding universal stress UspA family protein
VWRACRSETPEGAANSCYVHFLFDVIYKADDAAGRLDVQRVEVFGEAGKPDPIHRFEEMAGASAKGILDAAAKTAKMADISCEFVHVPNQHSAEGIIATAEKNGCDLIVMASHGRRALGRLLLGSQVNEVLAHGKIPVLIVRLGGVGSRCGCLGRLSGRPLVSKHAGGPCAFAP